MNRLEDIAKMAIQEVSAELDGGKKISEKKIEAKFSSNSELEFLQNVKERLCVLFEGLKENGDATRLDLTINFLEFLLANVEDRLSNLQK